MPGTPDRKTLPDRKSLISKLKSAARQLGKKPISRDELRLVAGVSHYQIRRHFDTYNDLLRAAGLPPVPNQRIADEDLLRELAAVFRRENGLVTYLRFGKASRFSTSIYQRRWGCWSRTLRAFRQWQKQHDPEFPYADQIDAFRARGRVPGDNSRKWTGLGGRRYGEALNFRGLLHAPVNEHGVIFLFAILAAELGFLIESLTKEFPDCEAKRRVGKGWERVRIEFEYESRNFRDHGHDPKGCDLIVCWEHNWPQCPIEVLELKAAVENSSVRHGVPPALTGTQMYRDNVRRDTAPRRR